MSAKVRREVDTPEYSRCSLKGIHEELIGECSGRITREHAVIFAGKKIQKAWAIIPLCAKHHGVDHYQDAHTEAPKNMRVWVALNRATEEDLAPYGRAGYCTERDLLNARFGAYLPPPILASAGINY